MNITDKIQILLRGTNKSDFALEKEIGLSQGSLKNWKQGKSKPSTEALTKIADYFCVSVDFLLGRDVKLPIVKLNNQENDMGPWYSDKLHTTLISLTKIADYLLEVKKNSINDSGINFIQQELTIAIDLVIRLISITNGVEKEYCGDECYLIIDNGIKGYKEAMKKIGIVPQLLHQTYANKNH